MKKVTTILHDDLTNIYFGAGIQKPVFISMYREYRSFFESRFDKVVNIIILNNPNDSKNLSDTQCCYSTLQCRSSFTPQ